MYYNHNNNTNRRSERCGDTCAYREVGQGESRRHAVRRLGRRGRAGKSF